MRPGGVFKPDSLPVRAPTEWRCCIGLTAYEVSDTGLVRRSIAGRTRRKGHLLKAKGGRYHLMTDSGNKIFKEKSHLVLEAFIGPRPSKNHMACHNNGWHEDNYYKNLRWGTNAENQADMKIHNTSRIGHRNGRSKLSPEQIRQLRIDFSKREAVGRPYGSLKQLNQKYGIVSSQHLADILSGKLWGHVL